MPNQEIRMNWDKIGAIGELVGALAVLVTLIYLAIQVTHARRAQQAEAIRSNRLERREYHTTLRDSPYIPIIYSKIDSGVALTAEEEYRLLQHNAATWGLWYSEWIQTQLQWRGKFETSQQETFSYLFAQPRALDFLEQHGRRLYPKEFIDYVEGLLENYKNQAGIA
jgi:hypothetical protein